MRGCNLPFPPNYSAQLVEKCTLRHSFSYGCAWTLSSGHIAQAPNTVCFSPPLCLWLCYPDLPLRTLLPEPGVLNHLPNVLGALTALHVTNAHCLNPFSLVLLSWGCLISRDVLNVPRGEEPHIFVFPTTQDTIPYHIRHSVARCRMSVFFKNQNLCPLGHWAEFIFQRREMMHTEHSDCFLSLGLLLGAHTVSGMESKLFQ